MQSEFLETSVLVFFAPVPEALARTRLGTADAEVNSRGPCAEILARATDNSLLGQSLLFILRPL